MPNSIVKNRYQLSQRAVGFNFSMGRKQTRTSPSKLQVKIQTTSVVKGGSSLQEVLSTGKVALLDHNPSVSSLTNLAQPLQGKLFDMHRRQSGQEGKIKTLLPTDRDYFLTRNNSV